MRTIFWYMSFIFSIIGAIPKLWKVRHYEEKEMPEERDAYIHKAVTNWMQGNIRRSGSTVEVIGKENLLLDQTVVYISNHQGNFDIPLLITSIDQTIGFISKIEAKKIPVIKTWMELIHCVFIDRSTLKSSAAAIIEGINEVKRGHSLVIFPEGTRSKGDQVGEFKHASFKLATKTGVPIIPITIDGSYKIMEKNHNKIVPAHVKITIHPAVPTANLSKEEIQKLPDQVADIITNALPV